MKRILVATILIILMSGPAAALIEENWAYGRRNVAMDGIECVLYDFEEGLNCGQFENQHPEVAMFLNVPSSILGYGPDKPSYVAVNGSMCGTTRCYMRIYPYDTNQDWIYVVDGRAAFSPVTCCESSDCWFGDCYPGKKARIEFKKGTRYISFLASTGNDLRIKLYDTRGNCIHSATVHRTINRIDKEPSNFTRFTIYFTERDIGAMTLSGWFNDWHIDDVLIGGELGYLPRKPVDYTYVAQRAQELYGVDYLPHGIGADYEVFGYLDPWQFTDGVTEEYWNPETKQFELGEGISNEGLILWAYNYDAMELADTHFVKRSTVAGMEKHDFKVDVDPADVQPGQVCFMDRNFDTYADEVYMVVEKTDTDMDLIYACPDDGLGVIYAKKSTVESSEAFMGYKRLPGTIRGGRSPIPKGH